MIWGDGVAGTREEGVWVMHITEIYNNDIPQIDGLEVACDERVNLLIGPNASGKSTILRAIKRLHSLALSESISSHVDRWDIKGLAGGLGDSVHYVDPINYPSPGGGLLFGLQVSDDWPRDALGAPKMGEVPFLYIPATRVGLPGAPVFEPNTIEQIAEDPVDEEANALLKRLLDTESGVFDGRYVELAIDRLRREIAGDRARQNGLRQALDHGYSCAHSICSEVISDAVSHPFVDQFETAHAWRVVQSWHGYRDERQRD